MEEELVVTVAQHVVDHLLVELCAESASHESLCLTTSEDS